MEDIEKFKESYRLESLTFIVLLPLKVIAETWGWPVTVEDE